MTYVEDPVSGCWTWTAARNSDGYGWAKGQGAHRYIYELLRGAIPAGLELDHLCSNRACVNPDHLEPVTHRENVLRGGSFAGVNARKTSCAQGHPFDEANTRHIRNADGSRQRKCRACHAASTRRWREKQRQVAA